MYKLERKLSDKIALITGGTSGIGESIARLFVKEGAIVVIVGRNEKNGERVATSINESFDNQARNNFLPCYFFKCDVTDLEQVRALKKTIVEKFNRIDVLVNNAGILKTSTLEEICSDNASSWHEVFRANTDSVMFMTSNFIDMLLASQGCIITNASNAGLQSYTRGRSTYAYAASKAAVIQFMKQCALNYTSKGIRINCMCPGVTETSIFTNRDFSRFLSSIPMARVAQPEEIAKVALFLASDDSSYISGSCITVDGGGSLL